MEYEGEFEAGPRFPRPIDIDDGIERDITIRQEIFGEIFNFGTRYDIMRFTLENKGRDSIQVKVLSLGATIQAILAPDRKGNYKDIVLGFDDPETYFGSLNPGFGRITSLCPLPFSLEKIVWEWDFDRDEGSVIFSTTFHNIDLVLTVKYTLTTDNEVIVELRGCGAKILPISLTSQVYWNLAGHEKGQDALNHHSLSVNSDAIWKHYNHKLANFIPVNGTKLDFRVPSFMDSSQLFGSKAFQHVYVMIKGCKQKLSFFGRMIHPRTCRYLELFSDQPWLLCNTFNTMPRGEVTETPPEYLGEGGEGYGYEIVGLCPSVSDEGEEEVGPYRGSIDSESGLPPRLKVLKGKDHAMYYKFGSFCMSPMHDLTKCDPLLTAAKHYSHTLIYKLGVYRRFCKKRRPCYGEECEEENFKDIPQD